MIKGTTSCYDRIIISGTIPGICFAEGMTSYLYSKSVRIFDYPKFAEPFKEALRANAEAIAKANDLEIEFVRSSTARKEDIVSKAVTKNGKTQGLLYILSAMEACPTYKPWHDKRTGKTSLRGDTGKCLHYYFYFNDPELGFGYIRVPTWCPFRLQLYFNGHNILHKELCQHDIKSSMADNAFDYIEDFPLAQELSDKLDIAILHKAFDRLAETYCPVHKDFGQVYHWSIMQAEYATDIIFKSKEDLMPIYDGLMKAAIHTVTPDNIATFLGHKLHPAYEGEIGNNYNVRIEGKRVKHHMGAVSIKMYDKFGFILRIETTVNNVTLFKHYRTVEHHDGSKTQQLASMKKNIYSLNPLRECLLAANRRYLEFISDLEDYSKGKNNLQSISQKVQDKGRTFRGFNLFDKLDLAIVLAILRGEFKIYGFRSKDVKRFLPYLSSSQISRTFKRLWLHGLIRKIAKSYKYYITEIGQKTLITCFKLKQMVIIPELNVARA
jgi:DNA-binding HxlR family transcriptional regulator